MLRLIPTTSSLASYRLVAGWVLGDAIMRFKRRIGVLAIFGGLGIFMQGGALGAALLYARGLESGEPVSLLGQQLDPRSDVGLLVLVALVLTGALLLGGYLLYRFKSGAISLGREYESLRIQETLAATSRLPDPAVSGASELLDEGHISRVQRDARFCGRVLRKIVEGFVPAVVVPVAGVVLLVVNPLLTILLVALTGFAAVAMFRFNQRGARASERMERVASEATRERKEAVRGLVSGDLRDPHNQRTPQVAETGTVKRHLDAYTDRLQAIEDSGLASSVVTALALGAILLIEGRAVLTGESSISALLTYLVVLRFFLTHFMRLSRALAAISRFYPQVKRHFTFAERAGVALSNPDEPAAFPCVLHLPALHTNGEPPQPRVEAGQRILLITDGHLTRKGLARLTEALEPPASSPAAAAHVRLARPAQPSSPHAAIEALGANSDTEWLDSHLAQLVSPETRRRLADGAAPEADGAATPFALPPTDAWIVDFLTALSRRPHAVVVHCDDWEQAVPDVRRLLIEHARETALVFVAGSSSPPEQPAVDVVVLARGDDLTGWCPPSEVSAGLAELASGSGSTGGGSHGGVSGWGDDEEDEEED